ncbi:hypothetical protein SAMN04490181_2092 [Pseudomonas brenneri]|uniref:Uncharacterized protein n=1 Tax=Pseudomonas brenneri TaxID=129817 RepID=A0ABY0WFF1_9PSED|nr:hypothetical protein [Pseudomonas sp. 25 R 14]SDU95428.1 hypothetical protein SAMN04490181_2092 [Pseudomonas brenneri]
MSVKEPLLPVSPLKSNQQRFMNLNARYDALSASPL